MVNMRILSVLLVCNVIIWTINGQTSDVNIGCIPLTIQFTGPTGQGTYYWDFKNGNESRDANPQAIFTEPGEYAVELYDRPGGTLIGTIPINVLEDPALMVEVVRQSNCAPFTVEFKNNSVIPEELEDVVYTWTFGDGNAMEGFDVIHTYQNAGVYDVSLRISSNITTCNQERLFEDFITVLEPIDLPSFTPSITESCDIPVTVNFTNSTNDNPDYQYTWDFGNGVTSNEREPGPQTYTESGLYSVRLTLTNAQGCSQEVTRQLSFGDGPPVLDVEIPDTVCFGSTVSIENNSNASSFFWTFEGANIQNSSLAEPSPVFLQEGPVNISVIAGPNGCQTSATFTTFVAQPDPGFTILPEAFCNAQETIAFQANNPNYARYLWSADTTVRAPNWDFDFEDAPRDSFHIHRPNTLTYGLTVTDEFGCRASSAESITLHRPWAHFIFEQYYGCIPMTVEFIDSSTSPQPINLWIWDFDDGTVLESTTNNPQPHTYTEAGTYYPRLIIENVNGCRDTSDAVQVIVGDQLDNIDFELDKEAICIGDTVKLKSITMDDRIDAWHFETDQGRSFHCYQESELDHVFFTETGSFDVQLTVEYNGCYSSVTKTNVIEVLGPKASIDYEMTCAAPYDVQLTNASAQAEQVRWIIPDIDTFLVSDTLYTFPDSGSYTVLLEASNESSGCPVQMDSVEIIISDITAEFEIEERYCNGELIELDAGASQGVDNACFKGYTWRAPGMQRPRTVGDARIIHPISGSGKQDFTLITEDINGCTDTLIKQATIYNTTAEFQSDKSNICLPASVQFTDFSTADTTITDWEWSFGSTAQNPNFTFTEATNPLVVSLTIMDAAGCSSRAQRRIDVYEPVSTIGISPGNQICLGDTLSLTANDFTNQGSFLNFDWDLGNGIQENQQNPTILYETPGTYEIILSIEEDATGCTNAYSRTIEVVGIPEAAFGTSVDSLEFRCAGQVIFTNQSGPEAVRYNWVFTDESGASVAPPTTLENPVYFLEKGRTNIQLIASNQLGCSDTISRGIDLTAPEGQLLVDDSRLCLGESTVFRAVDLVDVTSLVWDFGDGTIVNNQEIQEHTYTFVPGNGSSNVELILYTGDEACETILSTTILIDEVIAGFEVIQDDLRDCSVLFRNTSTGANQFEWDLGDGTNTTESDPSHLYAFSSSVPEESFVVQLKAISSNTLCESIALDTVDIRFDLDIIQMPSAFTPNGEEPNDLFNFVLTDNNEVEGIEVLQFQVFNRWGQLVYDNDTPEAGWDGNVDGEEAPEATYAYYIELLVKGTIRWEHKGSVLLLRPE